MNSSATIKRGSGKGGRSSSPRPTARRAPRKMTRLDKLIAMLPVSRQTLSKALSLGVAGLALAAVWTGAQFLGLPAMAGAEFAQMAARAGFQVAKVEVQGVKRMDEMPVYTLALDEMDRSILSVDLHELRRRVLTLGWVADARVTRRLPDTLVVDIVEREPVAVWQHGGKLSLIDVDGVVLESVDGRSMPDLPLVVGPSANRETRALQTLMGAAPALKPLLAGATWVGNRRWDLRFQSGETLALPEGASTAAAALMKFAQLDGVNRLLGRGIVRFDMRDPERFVLRLPPDRKTAGDSEAKPASDADTKKKGDESDKPEAKSVDQPQRLAQAGEA
jgi:cell division protein FtsQ